LDDVVYSHFGKDPLIEGPNFTIDTFPTRSWAWIPDFVEAELFATTTWKEEAEWIGKYCKGH